MTITFLRKTLIIIWFSSFCIVEVWIKSKNSYLRFQVCLWSLLTKVWLSLQKENSYLSFTWSSKYSILWLSRVFSANILSFSCWTAESSEETCRPSFNFSLNLDCIKAMPYFGPLTSLLSNLFFFHWDILSFS